MCFDFVVCSIQSIVFLGTDLNYFNSILKLLFQSALFFFSIFNRNLNISSALLDE